MTGRLVLVSTPIGNLGDLTPRAVEALRFRKLDPADDCQGALIWSYSDCWGETG